VPGVTAAARRFLLATPGVPVMTPLPGSVSGTLQNLQLTPNAGELLHVTTGLVASKIKALRDVPNEVFFLTEAMPTLDVRIVPAGKSLGVSLVENGKSARAIYSELSLAPGVELPAGEMNEILEFAQLQMADIGNLVVTGHWESVQKLLSSGLLGFLKLEENGDAPWIDVHVPFCTLVGFPLRDSLKFPLQRTHCDTITEFIRGSRILPNFPHFAALAYKKANLEHPYDIEVISTTVSSPDTRRCTRFFFWSDLDLNISPYDPLKLMQDFLKPILTRKE
jgi:hypothetical protein